jgi:hypothetical protein
MYSGSSNIRTLPVTAPLRGDLGVDEQTTLEAIDHPPAPESRPEASGKGWLASFSTFASLGDPEPHAHRRRRRPERRPRRPRRGSHQPTFSARRPVDLTTPPRRLLRAVPA